MTAAIEIRSLTVRFGTRTAVDALTLSVNKGEVLGLLGHNGAGKTTSIRAMNGLVEPASGTLRVLGHEPVRDGAALRRRVAVVTEASTLDERLTARETMVAFGALYDLPKGECAARAESLTSRLGLEGPLDERVAAYSKGMRQRLAIARALLHEPEILYLDEPTAGLDPGATRLVHRLVRRWSHDEGKTVIVCTHNLVEAQDLADRVAVLARGRLIAHDSPDALRRRIMPSSGLLIEVDPAQLHQAVDLLRTRAGLSVAPEQDHVRVTGALRQQIPQLVHDLVDAGLQLYRVAPVEPSLADAYFALQVSLPGAEGLDEEAER